MTTNSKCNLEIVRPLGVGGMATVYLARRDDGGRTHDVAVKKLHSFLASDSESIAVLVDEAQLGACINHPNVVRVIDFVEATSEADAPSLVLELVDGVDLGKLVRAASLQGTRLPVDVVAAIACDVLAGLHAAHESRRDDGLALDIVHRDVSPQNILVGFDGVVRVTDFGVAKATWRHQHTEQGSIKGKLGYLAPEQLAGKADRRADLFSVGAVIWELLTGKRLRSSEGVEVLVEILCAQIERPSAKANDAEAACLDEIVMRALERCPEDRFETAIDMCAAIVAAVTPASAARVAEVVRAIVETAEPTSAVATNPVAEKLDEQAPASRPVRSTRRPRSSRRRPSVSPPNAWATPPAEDAVLDLLAEMRRLQSTYDASAEACSIVCAGGEFVIAACKSARSVTADVTASLTHSLPPPTPSRPHRPPPWRRA